MRLCAGLLGNMDVKRYQLPSLLNFPSQQCFFLANCEFSLKKPLITHSTESLFGTEQHWWKKYLSFAELSIKS